MSVKEIYWYSVDELLDGIAQISKIHETVILPVFLASSSSIWNFELNRLGIPSYSGDYSADSFLAYLERFSKVILISEESYKREVSKQNLSILWKSYFEELTEIENNFNYLEKLQPLRETIIRLRAPGGCPYDQLQSHDSLKRNLIEEAYEIIEAIDTKDYSLLKEELGDLLLQIIFHAELAEEHQKFSLEDVIKDINEKLIRRHPHVFENTSNTIEIGTVLANWEEIKAKEKGKSQRGIIDGIPHSLPSLLRSFKILEKVEKVGFKWETLDQAIAKLKEEEFEFFSAEKSEDKEGELGDVFMAWVGVAHFFRLNPEIALQKTNQRFIERFKYLEKLANSGNFDLKECSSYDLLGLWDKAKKIKK